MSEAKKHARTSLYVMGEKVLKMATYLISGTVVARVAGPEVFGLYSTALATAVIFTTLSALGLNTLLVKEFLTAGHSAKVLTNAILLRAQAACALGLVTVLSLLVLLGLPLGLSVLAGALVPIALFQVIDSLFESRREMDRVLLYKGVGYIVGMVLKVGVVFWAPEAVFLMAAHVTEMLLILGGAVLALRRSPVWPSRAESTAAFRKDLLKKSCPLLLSSGAVILYMKVDMAMVLQIAGAEEAGFYAAATRLCEALFIFSVPIMVTFFPRLVTLYAEPAPGFDRLMGRVFLMLLGLGVGLSLCAVLAARPVVSLLYGAQFAPSGDIIQIYALSVPLVFISDMFSRWLIISDNLKLSAYRHFLGLAVNIGLNLVLIPVWGAAGAAMASVAGYASAGLLFALIHPQARPFFKFVRPQ